MRESDIAYEKIKEMIMTAKLMPGEVIVESEMMEQLKTGRTPMREALNRLAWENQVRIIPRQCIMVSELPTRELESVFQMRYALSSLEGELAATKATQADIANLKAIVRKMEKAKKAEKKVMLDRSFHRAIVAMTNNRFLEEEMNRLMDLSVRLIFLNKENLESVDTSTETEHMSMIDAIEAGDVSRTIQEFQEHVKHFHEKFVR